MKRLTIPEPLLGPLEKEIRRSGESRYEHRLHAVLLVGRGLPCPQVAKLLGEAPRTVEYWVSRFLDHGLGGLAERSRPGRPSVLTQEALQKLTAVLNTAPREAGLEADGWDGRTVREWIKKNQGMCLSLRQAQRLMRRLSKSPKAF